jgi:hypothetical protein
MTETGPALACDLTALSAEERTRRAALASSVFARFREVRETSDGYAGCLDADREHVRDVLEWVLLERRCCPFLRFELAFEPSTGPLWVSFGGGPGVKEFLTAAGVRASRPGERT